MRPEDKVCTLEQAKRLVELGVILGTEKYWYNHVLDKRWEIGSFNKALANGVKKIPAPDVAELGEILHPNFKCNLLTETYRIQKFTGVIHNYSATYTNFNNADIGIDLPEAQARCAALIWLIENNYLKKI